MSELYDYIKTFVESQKKKGASKDIQKTGLDAIVSNILNEVYDK